MKPLESGFDDPTLPLPPEGQRAPCPEGGSNTAPPSGWRCSCGAWLDPNDGAWRWNGKGWEHSHGGQGGHFLAEFIPSLKPPPQADRWFYSLDEEHYEGDFATREEAIAEGQAAYPGETIYVGKGVAPEAPEEFWDAEDWLDNVQDQDEYLIDCADGWDTSTKEQRAELEALVRPILGAWLDRHGLRPTFVIIPKAERIESPEPNEEDAA